MAPGLLQNIGRSVLDLSAGRVLGRVPETDGALLPGVEAKPDMIREARKPASQAGASQRFVLGDVAPARVTGRFDTSR